MEPHLVRTAYLQALYGSRSTREGITELLRTRHSSPPEREVKNQTNQSAERRGNGAW